jgi:hypothetical protein
VSERSGSAEPRSAEPSSAGPRSPHLAKATEWEREVALAELFARGRKRTRIAAYAWVGLAANGALQSLRSDTGRPLLSFALLGLTGVLALMLGAGMPVARWTAVLFTSARGLVGLQWAERLSEARSRAHLLVMSVLFLALAAALLLDRSIAHYCRPKERRA